LPLAPRPRRTTVRPRSRPTLPLPVRTRPPPPMSTRLPLRRLGRPPSRRRSPIRGLGQPRHRPHVRPIHIIHAHPHPQRACRRSHSQRTRRRPWTQQRRIERTERRGTNRTPKSTVQRPISRVMQRPNHRSARCRTRTHRRRRQRNRRDILNRLLRLRSQHPRFRLRLGLRSGLSRFRQDSKFRHVPLPLSSRPIFRFKRKPSWRLRNLQPHLPWARSLSRTKPHSSHRRRLRLHMALARPRP